MNRQVLRIARVASRSFAPAVARPATFGVSNVARRHFATADKKADQAAIDKEDDRLLAKALKAQAEADKVPSCVQGETGAMAYKLLQGVLSEKANARFVNEKLQLLGAASEKLDLYFTSAENKNGEPLSAEEKMTFVNQKIFPKMGVDKDSIDHKVVRAIVKSCFKHSETLLLKDVCVDFDTLVTNHFNEVPAVVTSAIPLSKAQQKTIATKVKAIEPKKSVLVDFKVDADILGGLVIDIGEQYQDLSARNQVYGYENLLRSA